MTPKLYRVTSTDDFENYYILKADPSAVEWSGFSGTPKKDSLKAHFAKIISNKDNFLYFLKDEDLDLTIGYIQFTLDNETEATYTGTSIHSNFQGRGYGKLITALMLNEAKAENIVRISGWCSHENEKSVHNMVFFGFMETNLPTKNIFIPGLNKNIEFSHFEKFL